MELSNVFAIYDNALESAVCADIIRRFDDDSENKYFGRVNVPGGDVVDNDQKRTVEISTSSPGWADIDTLLYSNINKYLGSYIDRLGGLLLPNSSKFIDQPYRIKKYEIGWGFDWHSDCSTGPTWGRCIAAQWYFNTVESGGETEFLFPSYEISCVEGRLAIFPVQWTTVHRGVAPSSGPKYICTTFFKQMW